MRKALLGAGVAGLAALFLWGLRGLPRFGSYPGPYGDLLNSVAVGERKATDIVSAVNFDYRAFDTMGEEFILFASVAGAALLLRKIEEEEDESKEESEDEDKEAGRAAPPMSDATRAFGVMLVGLNVLFGLYMISHGQTTPGGGFQGGVILATAPLTVYLAAEAETFQRIAPRSLVEWAESAGAAAYVLFGLGALVLGTEFLRNITPLGTEEKMGSAGNIFWLNLGVGIEVAGGFVLLLSVFIEEALRRRLRQESK
ncbi:MAG: MnhB domain-containing protein [Myxococcales bacterium]